ncbi:MAG: NAD(P)H-binding protein [Porticoccaceae bacterium]|nr:NAD(P)H-binding protein [Porticoccaceae bacterium]
MTDQLKILFAACGDIAQRAAARTQHQSFGLRRNPERLPAGIDPIAGDMTDSTELRAVLDQGFDVVVVTLTPSTFTEQAYRDSYLKGAQALSLAIDATEHKPKLVIWVSSTSVYGHNNGDWVDESTATNPQSFSGKLLLEAEQLIADLPCDHSIVRFSGIYGPGRTRMLSQVKAGKGRPAEPEQWSNRIYSDDCGGVLSHLIDLFAAGEAIETVYLATDSAPVTQHDLRVWMAAQMQVSLTDEIVVQKAVRRCSNQRLLASGFEFIYPSYKEGYLALMAK